MLTALASLKEEACNRNLVKAFKTYFFIQYYAKTSTNSHHFIISSISCLLLSCARLKLKPQGKQLHGQILTLGFHKHPNLVPKLITFYGNINELNSAHKITDNFKFLHPLPWNILISSYIRNGFYKEAILAYKQMISKGIRPDNFIYPSILKACGESFDLSLGKEIHYSILESPYCCCLFVNNALISMYGKVGELDMARLVFDEMPERDVVSWNAIVSAYVSNGMLKEALEMIEKMPFNGVEWNVVTWNTCAEGLLQTGNFDEALELLFKVRKIGICFDSVSVIIGLSACSHIGNIHIGAAVHGYAIRSSFDRVENVGNALITMYSRCHDLRDAYLLFQLMEDKSVVTWNAMLSGYADLGKFDEASFLFEQMIHCGVQPNYVSIASILSFCARSENLQYGLEFHCYILRRVWFKDYLLLWNSLVEIYARSGKVLEARRVFDSLRRRDRVSYTSLIFGYGIHGDGRAALNLFYEMRRNQIEPDYVTMIAVLSACSHSFLVNKGKMLFGKMYTVFGIFPGLEHFSCMVDLFARVGLLYEAQEKIIESMSHSYAPSAAMFATLLGACQIHKNKELEEWAAKKLFEIRPENFDLYAVGDSSVTKNPDWCQIDLGSGFFRVGGMSNPITDEIYMLLEGLTKSMIDATSVRLMQSHIVINIK